MLEAPRRSPLLTWSIAIGLAAGVGMMTLVAVRAAQREARFVEVIRHFCDHSGLSGVELHRIVRSEYRPGVHKDDALRVVSGICGSQG
jgi:hypothetical protein